MSFTICQWCLPKSGFFKVSSGSPFIIVWINNTYIFLTQAPPFKTQITWADSTLNIFLPHYILKITLITFHLIKMNMVTSSIPALWKLEYWTLASSHTYQQGRESTAGIWRAVFRTQTSVKKWQGFLCFKQHHQLTS